MHENPSSALLMAHVAFFLFTLPLVPKLFPKTLRPAGRGSQTKLGLQSWCCSAPCCQAAQGHAVVSSPCACSAESFTETLLLLRCNQQHCLRHCSTAGSSTVDVLFSAKYDHLQVCAGVSIFISHYSSPAGFPLK